MKATIRETYGGPEVLEVRDVVAPDVAASEVLIEVAAASLNAADIHLLRGTPLPARLAFGLRKPKRPGMGADVAGRVIAVGAQVTEFKVDDRVFGDLSGAGFGAFAEKVAAPASVLAQVPEGVPYEHAAASGMAAVTALQALRGKQNRGFRLDGQHVFVTGASGGVGSFAVQLAKALGAQVTALTSAANAQKVEAIGADTVIVRDDGAQANPERYDLILEAGGYAPVRQTLRLLKPGGRYVFVGGGDNQLMTAVLLGKSMLAKPDKQDLEQVAALLAEGKVRPLIGATLPLDQVAEGVRLFEGGDAAGKIVFQHAGLNTPAAMRTK